MATKQITLKWIRTKTHMIVILSTHPNQPVSFKRGTDKYKQMMKLKKRKNLMPLVEFLFPSIPIEEYSDGNFYLKNGFVYIRGTKEPLPTVLASKLLALYREKQPYLPIIWFWRNLAKNSDKNVKEQLWPFLEKNNHPFTTDGCFLAYRKVVKDKKGNLVDGQTRKMSNAIGKVVSIPRAYCNSDPHQTCSSGLHVASFNYGYSGDVHLEVKVNPKNVVSVPYEYGSAKMRCCEFEVLGLAPGKERGELWVSVKGHTRSDRKITTKFKTKVLKVFRQKEVSLEGRTAKEIIDLVDSLTDNIIALSPKNKKGVVKHAIKLLNDNGFTVMYDMK